MNYTTLQEAVDQAELPVEVETLSVYRAFDTNPHSKGLH